MRLLPRALGFALLGRRDVDRVMHPAVPARRNHSSLGVAVEDHPAAFESKAWVDFTAAGAVVAIAEFVFTDEFAIQPGPHLGAEGLAIPPGEETQKKGFHQPDSAMSQGALCHPALQLSRQGRLPRGMAPGSTPSGASPPFRIPFRSPIFA